MSVTMREADLIVVGGGSSGATLASIIARDTDLRVMLIEAGPDYGPYAEGRWPADILDARSFALSHQWAYAGLAHPTHTHMTGFDRARIMGGCSSHNGCVALVGHRCDYDGWAALGNTGWDWESVAPAFARARQAMKVRIPCDDEVTPFQRVFVEGAVAGGWPRSADLNDPDEIHGVAASPANIDGGVRWNTSLAYIDPARRKGNLTIVDNALVDKVDIQRGRAVAVEAIIDLQRQRFEAPRIVLSGGTYGSPAILLRSGVGPESHLRDLDVPVVQAREGVGRCLNDHPSISLFLDSPPALDREMDAFAETNWVPDEQTLAKARSSQCSEGFDLHIVGITRRDRETGKWGYLIALYLVDSRGSGSLTLQSTKPGDHPLLDHQLIQDPDGHDLAAMTEGIEIASDWMRTTPFERVFGRGPDPTPRDDLAEYLRAGIRHAYHPVSTCRMGPSTDPGAVVDPRGKVHGVDGLYVCDASIFPRIMRANTNLPAIMLGEHMAPWISANLP
ncbi:MAG TPA: GMC family oxidoreductase [Thermomicrobiales bacterium]|nr:GMC family oxidoreductase [Thermomicrobiales bacterium]